MMDKRGREDLKFSTWIPSSFPMVQMISTVRVNNTNILSMSSSPQPPKYQRSIPSRYIYIPVPVGQSHHDVKWSKEKHEVKKWVTVSNPISLIINSTVEIISIIKGAITSRKSILNQCWFITGQSQFIYLTVIGCSNAVVKKINILIMYLRYFRTAETVGSFQTFSSPWIEHTQQKQNEPYNSLGIPPMDKLALAWSTCGIIANYAQQTWITLSV